MQGNEARLHETGMSDAIVEGMFNMMVAKDEGMDNMVERTQDATTPTSFRQWCEEELRPAVLG